MLPAPLPTKSAWESSPEDEVEDMQDIAGLTVMLQENA